MNPVSAADTAPRETREVESRVAAGSSGLEGVESRCASRCSNDPADPSTGGAMATSDEACADPQAHISTIITAVRRINPPGGPVSPGRNLAPVLHDRA